MCLYCDSRATLTYNRVSLCLQCINSVISQHRNFKNDDHISGTDPLQKQVSELEDRLSRLEKKIE